MGDLLKKNCLSPQSEEKTEKLCFSVVLKHFRENSQRTSFLDHKVNISEKSMEILRKFVLLNIFEKRKIMRKICI